MEVHKTDKTQYTFVSYSCLIIILNNHNIFPRKSKAAVFKEGQLGNYEPTDLEPRTGPGEGGTGVVLSASEKNEGDRSVREFGFNMVASDKISLDRRIKDTRPAECKYWHYPETSLLPTASVVIVFVNEGWSTLIRTVHSVINTSPPELLAEVILIVDYSNKGEQSRWKVHTKTRNRERKS